MPTRPRIALVCGRLNPALDGVADYTARLAVALRGAGADPVVVTTRGADVPAGLRVEQVAEQWDARGLVQVSRALRLLRPDVVHVQFAPSAYAFSPYVGVLPLLVRRPVVTTLHEYGWWQWPERLPDRAVRALERAGWWDRETLALAPRSAAVVATNGAHAAQVQARLGRRPAVVPIGSNIPVTGGSREQARRATAAALALAPGTTLLVFFGFVHPVKGLRYLLDALAQLRRDREVHLVVAGGATSAALPGDEAAAFVRELEAHAQGLGVRGAVTFTGHLPDAEVSRLLLAADAVVLPMTAGVTTRSGALVAALEHGAAVVATAPDEPDPTLVDGRHVVLVPARRDGPALAAGIARVLDDRALQLRLREQGRALVAPRGWATVADAHLALYASL